MKIGKPPLNDSLFADGHSVIQSRPWMLWFQQIYDLYNNVLKYSDPSYRFFGQAAPDNPAEGLIAYADGVSWNQGGGVGYYRYYSGGWVRIG